MSDYLLLMTYIKVEINNVNKILADTEVVYDSIATKFSQTRKHFWRGLEFIEDYAKKNSKIFDYGCGNGRLLELIGDLPGLEYYGADISQRLIDLAKSKYLKATFLKLNPNQTSLSFKDNFFNSVYSVAVFHHFPSEKYREDMAKELFRITARGGYVIVTVWNLWQKKYIGNILENWYAKIFKGSIFDWNDCYISFKDNRGNKFQRFHHAYTKRELRKLFANAGFEIESCEIVDGRNIVLVGKK